MTGKTSQQLIFTWTTLENTGREEGRTRQSDRHGWRDRNRPRERGRQEETE